MDKHRILIVDDDVMISDLISLYLEKEMYEVMKVHNGLDALSAFNEFDPSLILLDLMLPG
ncbi:MAG: response regulator, partial [Lachnospiraceae bacterium]|nr:response regulator [Lachnospiraceae bacterium]